jgi:hypothetical protein
LVNSKDSEDACTTGLVNAPDSECSIRATRMIARSRRGLASLGATHNAGANYSNGANTAFTQRQFQKLPDSHKCRESIAIRDRS